MPRLQIPNPRNVQGLVSAGGLGVLSACNAPLRGHTVTVQRNAAEVRGVPARAHRNISLHSRPRGVQRGFAPLRFSYIDPPRMGAGGLKASSETASRRRPPLLMRKRHGSIQSMEAGQRRLRQQPVQSGAWRQTVFPCWTSSAWYSLNSASS